MNSVARTAIIIGLVASQASAATANNNRKLRGRALEGECEGIGNGTWRPSPGCKGAVWCFNNGPFFLYPCEDDQLYDEDSGACRSATTVTCRNSWSSIVAVSDAVKGALDDNEDVGEGNNDEGDKDKRMCDNDAEKRAFKACKKNNCVHGDEACKTKCREDSCEW